MCVRRDSFSDDDSFESNTTDQHTDEVLARPLSAAAAAGMKKTVTFGGSQDSLYSEISQTTSQYRCDIQANSGATGVF